MIINLPPTVYEAQFFEFIKLLGKANLEEEITLNFLNVHQYPPKATTFLIAKIMKWKEQNKEIILKDFEDCPAFTYLQRINFFDICDIQTTEDFNRHDSTGKFVPLTIIPENVGELSTDVAECIAPELIDSFDPDETGFFDCIEYSISELGNNTKQHSDASHPLLSAQYYGMTDYIRVAISDNGIGINSSFRNNNSPHSEHINNDLDAINKALEASVSSKTHLHQWGEAVNAGVGLSLLKELAKEIDGHFILVSGNAYYSLKENKNELFDEELKFEGTLCAFTFRRSTITNFPNLLYRIKQGLGLINENGEYEDLFT